MANSIDIQGVDELNDKLEQMGRKAATKYARAALRPAAKLIQREAKSLVPVKSGKLKGAIRINNGKTTQDQVSVFVGPSIKVFPGNGWYARFQEEGWFLGHRLRRFTGKDRVEQYRKFALASGRKFVPGRHFMQVAFDNTKTAAEASIGTEMVKALEDDWNA